MKKILTVLLAALLCLTLFAACGAPAEPAAPASEAAPAPEAPAEEPAAEPAEAPADAALPETFVLGLDASFPPMGYLDENNEIVGVDIDLARAVCEKLGMKFEPKPIDWDAKDMELGTDKINCIWNGLTVTDERIENYELSDAYMDNEQVIVVMQDSPIKSKADLAGKIVAAQKDSSGLEALQKDEVFPSIKDGVAKEYANYVDALTDLEIGRCDAIVMDSVVANYYIAENAKPMTILEDKMASEQYAIAFKKGNTALKDAVWNALGELADEGKIAEISQKWFGRDDMIKVK
ncbi:amino acid ABC transporter substrate-binding protein [Anaerotruncus massiliensis (ex Togo et al. 2019)]|uniref:amino acid ABC transporter substrate-binding protein n=1 Tax=Anaerotruncus massiliensis (ex Togo et al. 2019) TaxID=1673720 RepID=UPI0027BB0987|nr:amino acid ABC transporter substrate-binding protein [Anaerotruncus massiliensis (ex Togo et al. 2019)]